MPEKYRHLFGPVPSRRFGRSLGVDLTPPKLCCLDCVFCQLGHTTQKTIIRKAYIRTQAVLDELHHWFKTGGSADYITLSGSGEPTLHARFGEVLDYIGRKTRTPTALLTNGALFYRKEVRRAAARADVVKISLSAWHQPSFEWVNRPHPKLSLKRLVEGQKAFRDQFKGQLWLEVFLIAGMNAAPGQVQKIASLAKVISPDRIHLNTAVRPPAEDFVVPLAPQGMAALTHLFEPQAEVIAEFDLRHCQRLMAGPDTIFEMLKRRPCTAEQMAEGFGMHPNEVLKYLGYLLRANRVRIERRGCSVYYAAQKQPV